MTYGPEVFEDVLVNHEALVFRRGRIHPGSFVTGSAHAAHYRRPSRYAWFLAKNYGLRRGHVTEASGLWAIDNYTPDNYHHWMMDVLPRILRAEEDASDERTLLLPSYYQRNAYIEFTLRAFPNVERIGWIGARSKTRVARLTLVPRQEGDRLAAQLPEVGRRVASLAGEPAGDRRIYFTRDDARWRRIRNEADVVRVLREHDVAFHRVDPSRPWEQIRASAGADLIVGVHGASLTNLMFMAPGGRLLELRHPHDEHFFDAYRPLASAMGIDYTRQDCQVAGEASELPVNNRDLIVDLDVLRQNLR